MGRLILKNVFFYSNWQIVPKFKMTCIKISMNSVAWLNLPHKVPDKLKVGTLFGSNVNTSHICNRLFKGWIPNIVIIRIYDLRSSISPLNKKYFGLSSLHSRCFAVRTNTQVFCAQEQDVSISYSDVFKNYVRKPKQTETTFPPTFKADLYHMCSVCFVSEEITNTVHERVSLYYDIK